MIRSVQIIKSVQAGQGMTEYVIILTVLVFTFLAPVTPPSVPDWASDGVGARQLECPVDPYNPGAGRPGQCSVVEILAEVIRRRNDGYTYAISSTFYPERKVRISTNIFGDPGDPSEGGGVPGDPGSSAGGEGSEPSFGVGGATGQQVVVKDGEVIGKVNSEDQCVVDEAGGTIIGKVVGNEVWQTDSDCQLEYDSDGNHIVIGYVGNLQGNGEVVDEDGNVIGSTEI